MMKTKNLWCRAVGLAVAMWSSAGAAETAAGAVAAERVGIYDSRAVAYAHFWSAEAERSRNEAIAAGKAAKAAGDTAVFEAKSRMMADYQKRMHDQVFSSAPATDAMAALAARMPTLLGEIGVERLVSKWDEKALKAVPAEKRVDVTEKLVREFITPNEKQQKVLDSMKTTEPVPRWKMSLLKIFPRG